MKQMRVFLTGLTIIVFFGCGKEIVREKLPESNTIRNIHITPTIYKDQILWKVTIDWISMEKGRIRISEASKNELILDSKETSKTFIGNLVSENSILYDNPDKSTPVVWIVSWEPERGSPETLRFQKQLSGELKTSIQHYIKNR